jgi:hypothetical protein
VPIDSNFCEVYVKKAREETIDIDYRQALKNIYTIEILHIQKGWFDIQNL